MKRALFLRKLRIAFYVGLVLLACHHFIWRPIFLDWGSPASLRSLTLSGDTFTNGGKHTRAVLIRATPLELWPWLIQIGQERGGFYSYQWLENLFRADMENVYLIKSDFQQPRVKGDTVWLANKDRYNGRGFQMIAEIIPLKSYVMVGDEDYVRIQSGQKASGSWAFYLHPQTDTTTWLIARSSFRDERVGGKVFRYVAYEVPHFIMEVKMLKAIKSLAEGNQYARYKLYEKGYAW